MNCLKENTEVKNNRFINPISWNTYKFRYTFRNIMERLMVKNNMNIPPKRTLLLNLPIKIPNFTPESYVKVTWLGHSTILIQYDDIVVITDPIWDKKILPFGKRFTLPPCEILQLPKINIILISHNHKDHLSYNTLKKIIQYQRSFYENIPFIFVPLGLKPWIMNNFSIYSNYIYELKWWEYIYSYDKRVKITCTPAKHWSGRKILDKNKTLWCGWAIDIYDKSFFFAGDSGYCKIFKSIGYHLGPFDFAAIPIGGYQPRKFVANNHMTPKEAVFVHTDIKSKKSIGIHWGTYKLSQTEYYLEPKMLLDEECEKNKVPNFKTVNIGQTFSID